MRKSPAVIFLKPPEKLVLEVEATGGYDSIEWSKDNETICPVNRPEDSHQLVFFNQILYHSVTSHSDYGQYKAEYKGVVGGVKFLVQKSGGLKIKSGGCIWQFFLYVTGCILQ